MRNEVSTRWMLEGLISGILESGHTLVLDGSFHEQIGDIVSQDSTETLSPEELVRRRFDPGRRELLDFGCGEAHHRPMLEDLGYRWTGINYNGGMEHHAAIAASLNKSINFYDGLILPYDNETFDVVYSFQTFEHIQNIETTFSEIARVLRPDGHLIGSVSYLEQIHDYSTFNFTPIGLKLACEQSGLALTSIYPRYDVFTWMLRRLLISTSGLDDNSLSEVLASDNAIGLNFVRYGQRLGLPPKEINLMRLMYSAHFSFEAEKRNRKVVP